MKKQTVILALGALVFGQAYSSQPLDDQAIAQITEGNKSLTLQMTQDYASPYTKYVKTQLTAKDVTKKSLVTVNEQNLSEVIAAFNDSFREAVKDTGTAIQDTEAALAQIFQDFIVRKGETAKEVLNSLKQKAEEMFPTASFALSLDEKIRNLKFVTGLGGTVEAIRREPIDYCCGILSCILGMSYDYFRIQQGTDTQATTTTTVYPQSTINTSLKLES